MANWAPSSVLLPTRWKATALRTIVGEAAGVVVASNRAKLHVLFLCTGNSCRSQMAEGWARHLKGDCIEAYSAGVVPHGMNQTAVKVMQEAGVDITGQSSKHVDAL